MQIVYAYEPIPEVVEKSIFLAGPTPREPKTRLEKFQARRGKFCTTSWRPEAIRYLKDINFDGVVFVPEPRDGKYASDYNDQVDWEAEMLRVADVILFWVPRNVAHNMPAFTTNVEWGTWIEKDPSKVVFGAPEDAEKVKYLKYYADKCRVPNCQTLLMTCIEAKKKIGAGAVRHGGERYVPLHIWKTPQFQSWYSDLKAAGNRLDEADVKYVLNRQRADSPVRLFVLQAKVYVTDESRHIKSEIALMREDIVAALLYLRDHEDISQSKVALIREARTAVSNDTGKTLELASGSSDSFDDDRATILVDEVTDELGLTIEHERFQQYGSRQLAATILTHKAHLAAAEVTVKEMAILEQNAASGIARGEEGSTERAYTVVSTFAEIMQHPDLDWSTKGMIAEVLWEH